MCVCVHVRVCACACVLRVCMCMCACVWGHVLCMHVTSVCASVCGGGGCGGSPRGRACPHELCLFHLHLRVPAVSVLAAHILARRVLPPPLTALSSPSRRHPHAGPGGRCRGGHSSHPGGTDPEGGGRGCRGCRGCRGGGRGWGRWRRGGACWWRLRHPDCPCATCGSWSVGALRAVSLFQ
jgi:hypothetical protein